MQVIQEYIVLAKVLNSTHKAQVSWIFLLPIALSRGNNLINTYLLTAYYVPGPVLEAVNTAISKA